MSEPTADIMAYDFGYNSYELPFSFFCRKDQPVLLLCCYGVAISRGRRHFSRTFIPFSSYVSQKHENPTISSRSESLSISYKRLFLVEKTNIDSRKGITEFWYYFLSYSGNPVTETLSDKDSLSSGKKQKHCNKLPFAANRTVFVSSFLRKGEILSVHVKERSISETVHQRKRTFVSPGAGDDARSIGYFFPALKCDWSAFPTSFQTAGFVYCRLYYCPLSGLEWCEKGAVSVLQKESGKEETEGSFFPCLKYRQKPCYLTEKRPFFWYDRSAFLVHFFLQPTTFYANAQITRKYTEKDISICQRPLRHRKRYRGWENRVDLFRDFLSLFLYERLWRD